jgi:hypothetical protein
MNLPPYLTEFSGLFEEWDASNQEAKVEQTGPEALHKRKVYAMIHMENTTPEAFFSKHFNDN